MGVVDVLMSLKSNNYLSHILLASIADETALCFSQKPILLLEIGLTSIGAINFKGKTFLTF